ncbi:BOI-related E3 ubiquitin-protein ligase 1-like isoform X2 [Oryza brachyantha]|uniref:BOI-related E3 ubiquitin-protein ligase 1-like isoform X2 n=1 Tax=Oryza brachyantha TaxID=4533 RepID=UPI001ADCD8F7|nr:BOI-related E3 ubiquitin-protein ligase 1-like isoform X2 [Oryza brachyantha]
MGDVEVWLLSRGVVSPENTRAAAMEFPQMTAAAAAAAQQQQPPLFLEFSRGVGDGDGGSNSRKRPREAEAAMATRMLSLQPQAPQGHKVVSLAQLHKRPATGLRLDFDDGSEHVSTTSSASSLLPGELATQFDQYKDEMAHLLQDHTERLRRALGEARRRHYRSLLGAAEAAAARRMREKEVEASKAARRGAELEERVARLRAEAATWQAKALADQSTAAALHAQLQQAAAAAQARGKAEEDNNGAAAAADDAESGFVDPDRVEEVIPPPPPPPSRPCRTCRQRPSSVVLLPCRHLCVCEACEPAVSTAITGAAAAAAACPTCRGAVTGTVQVFLS